MNAAHFARHALQGALLMLALGGCKTQSSSAPQDAGTPHQQRTDAQQGAITTADVEAIITRVETWRDRPLDSPLKLEAHAKGDTLPVALLSQSIPESVVRAAKYVGSLARVQSSCVQCWHVWVPVASTNW